MGRLDGRVALVTGASRGIGTAIAARFAAEGAAVAVSARTVEPVAGRLPGTLGETVRCIRAAGGTAEAFPADLSRPEEREALAAGVRERLGPVDVLVNNAAVTFFSPVREFTARRAALMFEVQVHAPMQLAQLVVPEMAERGRGWILNVSSGAARHPALPPTAFARRGGTVYGMCKAALERFSTGLAAELYEDGIAVNALAPNRVVPTPGTVFHHLTTMDDPDAEPPAVMAEAALALCCAPVAERPELSGRIAYSQDLLTELGLAVPAS
ncbi:SDR family NAD(P)-dependent oxidoreductase [Phaeacidiphilus oryzae]|uniref:SDR family NAD(P)-dependent oxidoreductase n=1 Tax=Phaeacidiphilus oryzae TaxID=348818 RepID=UPI00055AC82A|nr:SDR family NAD(P)-dependent oxidoreductase [Phaeacidiphilus oryzae]